MRTSRSNYRKDKLYSRVTGAVHEILQESGVVRPVDVLIHIGYLDRQRFEDWRLGRIPYLERVLQANLSKLQRVLRILRLHAEDRGLRPSHTQYKKGGKGCKHLLRFSKTGKPFIETLYSTHYLVGPGGGSNRREKQRKATAPAEEAPPGDL